MLYPYVTRPEILVSMSQDAYDNMSRSCRDGGLLIYRHRPGQAEARSDRALRVYGVPATRFAEEMGNRLFGNLVVLGFFTAVTKVVSPDAMKKALPGLVPGRFLEVNIKAFEKGYDYGIELQAAEKAVPPKAEPAPPAAAAPAPAKKKVPARKAKT